MYTMTIPSARSCQQGVALLEALIAILIFSIGILSIVALQAVSVNLSADAKYRSDASLLANQLIGNMWVADRTAATLRTNFSSAASGIAAGANYAAWQANVANTLPGVSGVAATQPTVTITPVTTTGGISSMVTVTVFWKPPSEPAAIPAHQYLAIAQII